MPTLTVVKLRWTNTLDQLISAARSNFTLNHSRKRELDLTDAIVYHQLPCTVGYNKWHACPGEHIRVRNARLLDSESIYRLFSPGSSRQHKLLEYRDNASGMQFIYVLTRRHCHLTNRYPFNFISLQVIPQICRYTIALYILDQIAPEPDVKYEIEIFYLPDIPKAFPVDKYGTFAITSPRCLTLYAVKLHSSPNRWCELAAEESIDFGRLL